MFNESEFDDFMGVWVSGIESRVFIFAEVAVLQKDHGLISLSGKPIMLGGFGVCHLFTLRHPVVNAFAFIQMGTKFKWEQIFISVKFLL